MSVEENKDLVRRYFETGGRNDLAAWDELCDPSMALIVAGFPQPMTGLDAVKQFSGVMHSAMPDYTLMIEDLVAEGDRVAARWNVRGTHTAPLQAPGGAIPPTGKTLTITGISILTTANGKITEERVSINLLGLFQQLGLVPSA
jgi:predicted ester cyclase